MLGGLVLLLLTGALVAFIAVNFQEWVKATLDDPAYEYMVEEEAEAVEEVEAKGEAVSLDVALSLSPAFVIFVPVLVLCTYIVEATGYVDLAAFPVFTNEGLVVRNVQQVVAWFEVYIAWVVVAFKIFLDVVRYAGGRRR